MSRIYQKIGHGFVPFLKVLVNACSEESGKYIHYGITTQNIQQSSQLYMMKTVHNKFMLLLSEILENLSRLAEKTKHMVMPAGHTAVMPFLSLTATKWRCGSAILLIAASA